MYALFIALYRENHGNWVQSEKAGFTQDCITALGIYVRIVGSLGLLPKCEATGSRSGAASHGT